MAHRNSLSILALTTLSALAIATSWQEPPVEIKQGGAAITAAHCDAIATHSSCMEYASEAEGIADCGSYSGTVGRGACDPTGQVGQCDHGGKSRHYYRTGSAKYDAGYAERHCKNTLAGAFKSAP